MNTYTDIDMYRQFQNSKILFKKYLAISMMSLLKWSHLLDKDSKKKFLFRTV